MKIVDPHPTEIDRSESYARGVTTRRLILRKENGEIIARTEREDSQHKVIDETTDIGTSVHHRTHQNGAMDGKVRLKAIRIRMTEGGGVNVEHAKAIGAMQEASNVYMIAKHSGNDQWRRHARARLGVCAARLRETQ